MELVAHSNIAAEVFYKIAKLGIEKHTQKTFSETNTQLNLLYLLPTTM